MSPNRKAEAKEVILKTLKAGNTKRCAYLYAGVPESTFYDWLKDPQFSELIDKAEAEAETHHVVNILKSADKGNWQASAWWLERRKHKDYSKIDRNVIAGDPDSPLLIKTEITYNEQEANDILNILIAATSSEEPEPCDSSPD